MCESSKYLTIQNIDVWPKTSVEAVSVQHWPLLHQRDQKAMIRTVE